MQSRSRIEKASAQELHAMLERTRRLRRQRTLYGLLAMVAVIAGLVAGWQWVVAARNEKKAVESS